MTIDEGYLFSWILWIAMFLGIEGPTVFKRYYPGTLTAHIRKWAALRGKPKAWIIRRFVLIVSLLWLVNHFIGELLIAGG